MVFDVFRNGGGSTAPLANLLNLAREIGPEHVQYVQNWGDEVIRLLTEIANGQGATSRVPFAVNNTEIPPGQSVLLDFMKIPGRPLSRGWIYNAGETPLDFRYLYSAQEHSGGWIPYITIPAGHQVSLSTVLIQRLELRPTNDGESAVFQLHLV